MSLSIRRPKCRGLCVLIVSDAAETGFVLKQQAHPCLRRKPGYFLGEDLGEFFRLLNGERFHESSPTS